MKRPHVLCVGSLCLDTLVVVGDDGLPIPGRLARVSSITETLGGCCGNAAVALSRMGAAVTVAARLGDDEAGETMMRLLGDDDVRLAVAPVSGRTSRCVVLSSDTRSFLYQPGVNEDLRLNDVPSNLAQFEALLVSDPFLTEVGRSELAALLKAAHDAGVFAALDLCWDPTGEWERLLEGCWPLIDLVLAGADEARQLTGFEESAAAARRFAELGARMAVVKAGEGGLFCVAEGEAIHESAASVDVVDSTGAGDWCSAGVLLGALGGDPRRAAAIGALAGACCVTSVGGSTARPSHELLTLLANPTTTLPSNDD
jgi:sugar/nucleoside kinase (ribokinase family)